MNIKTNGMLKLVFSTLFLALFLVIHQFVFLHGDDFVYGLAARNGIAGFFRFHADHYMTSNGRAIIHVLLTTLLIFDVYLWRIINPILLLTAIYFAAKCTNISAAPQNNKLNWQALLFTAALFLCFRVQIMREAVFWMSGSLNYVYPMMLFFITYYLFSTSLTNGKNQYYLPILTFITAATTEHTGAMFVIAITTCFAAHLFKTKKAGKIHIIALITTFAGFLTVILAPGIMNRFENEGTSVSLFNISSTFNFFITSPSSQLYIILFTLAAISLLIFMFIVRPINARTKLRHLRTTADISAFIILIVFLIIYLNQNNWHTNQFFLSILVSYTIAVSYILLSFFFYSKQIAPFSFFAAAFAGQAVLIMADMHVYRTLFSPLFALFIPIITIFFTITNNIKLKKNMRLLKNAAITTLLILLCLAGSFNYTSMLRGYMRNRTIHLHNLQVVNYVHKNSEYLKENNITLADLFIPLYNKTYAYDELSSSAWYIIYFLRYHNIFEKIDITDQTLHRRNRVFINQELAPLRNAAIEIYGILHIPLRNLLEIINLTTSSYYSLEWDNKTQTTTVTKNNQLLFSNTNNTNIIYFNGQPKTLPAISLIIHNRLYLPIDVLSIGFGFSYIIEQNYIDGYDLWIFYE